MVIGAVLLAAAMALTGFNVWDEHRADQAASGVVQVLQKDIEQERATSPSSTQPALYQISPKMEMPAQQIDGESYIGVLTIPVLGLELPIMRDWSYPGLRKAPCRYYGSAYTNDLVIAGHNYNRHFGGLSNLSVGDAVLFTDMSGNQFSYTVEELETLRPTAVEEMTASGWDLTLFTCTYSGQARVTVRCRRVAETS